MMAHIVSAAGDLRVIPPIADPNVARTETPDSRGIPHSRLLLVACSQ